MRYVQLRAFHYVAISGGFSRAAEALFLTQPAISDQVRKLETEYDVRLFNRERKQVSPTPAGEQLLEITRRLFEVEAQAMEMLSQTRAVKSGHLTICADAAHHVTNILGPFQKKYPNVFVSVTASNTEAVTNMLNTYEADIGVLGQRPKSDDYEIIRLNSTPIVAFASIGSAAAKKSTIKMEELAKLPLVMREKGSKTRAKFEDFARKKGIELQVKIEAEGREAVREIVASGEGVGIVSDAEFGKDARLKRIAISNSDLTIHEAIICLKERTESPLIRSFMAVARETLDIDKS